MSEIRVRNNNNKIKNEEESWNVKKKINWFASALTEVNDYLKENNQIGLVETK